MMINNIEDLSTQLLYSTVHIIAIVDDSTRKTGTGIIIDMSEQKNISIPVLVMNNHLIENSQKIIIELFQLDNNSISKSSIRVEFGISEFIFSNELDIAIALLAPVINMAKKQNIITAFKKEKSSSPAISLHRCVKPYAAGSRVTSPHGWVYGVFDTLATMSRDG